MGKYVKERAGQIKLEIKLYNGMCLFVHNVDVIEKENNKHL